MLTLTKELSYARYQAIAYLKPEAANGLYDNAETISRSLAGIRKNGLVKRLESSFHAFKVSINNFKQANPNMIDMFNNNKVFIAPDLDINNLLVAGWSEEEIEEKLNAKAQDNPKNAVFKANDFKPKFIEMLQADQAILEQMCDDWSSVTDAGDSKFSKFNELLKHELFKIERNPEQKLVVFSESVDTVEYLAKRINRKDVLVISAKNRSSLFKTIRENFDANFKNQINDYNIILTTDVLAEGINLHRSNVIVNYDTPWNSTRLMQRIGRVNRIGSVSKHIYNYVFYPSREGNWEINLNQMALSKIQTFHSTFGEDNQIYSQEEVIDRNLGKLFDDAMQEQKKDTNQELPYYEVLRTLYQTNRREYNRIAKLSLRSRTGRASRSIDGVTLVGDTLVFLKTNFRKVFFLVSDEAKELSVLDALKYFKALPEESPIGRIEQHHKHVEKALHKFRSIQDEEIKAQESGQDNPASRGAQVSTALSLLTNFMREIDDSELYLKVVQLKALAERGVITYISKRLQRIQKELKDTMRYTYLLGEGRGCRTAIDQFSTLKNSKQTLADITEAFSVEALTKQFYRELFDWYLWAIDPITGVSFPNNTSIEDDDREDIETKIIRMITRIMFVWFIKQKNLVPYRLFNVEYLQTILKDFDPNSTTRGNYYNAILQNLFFATLNRAIIDEDGNKRKFATATKKGIKTLYRYAELFSISEQEVIDIFAEVPFLSGGLFECLDKTKTIDGVEQAYNFDGFSRNNRTFADGRYKNRAVVPNVLFFDEKRGLFPILNKYNFTIEENTPEEQLVALDPELLGKVFENLLGEYNPETKETARNQSGSFYTPREIVKYMVDESLISYLGNSDFTHSLFAANFKYEESHKDEYKTISKKLKAVKVLDPAYGSGASPMGLLNRMVEVLQRIEPDCNVYEQKLAIIENCLYGSDIQSIAAQITKLRFFISLIVDCERDASKPNFGIPTLPNLETKFVAANSLIGKKKNIQRSLFENPEIEPTKQELAKVRHEHFMAKSASAKRRLREKDQELREKLASLLAEDNNFAPEDAKQLASWNPYDQNSVSKFFDPKWMFGLSEHPFDIVIGNPPYIQLQNSGGELAKLYADCGYKTFARTGDIYCLFYERGQQLLKDGGHLCYITSNKWMRAGYGEKIRDFFAKNTNPQLLIDFAGVKIFESATVDINILLFSKSAKFVTP